MQLNKKAGTKTEAFEVLHRSISSKINKKRIIYQLKNGSPSYSSGIFFTKRSNAQRFTRDSSELW